MVVTKSSLVESIIDVVRATGKAAIAMVHAESNFIIVSVLLAARGIAFQMLFASPLYSTANNFVASRKLTFLWRMIFAEAELILAARGIAAVYWLSAACLAGYNQVQEGIRVGQNQGMVPSG